MINKKLMKQKCIIAIENIIKVGTTDVELFNKPFEIEFLNDKEFKKMTVDEIYSSIYNAVTNKKFDLLKIHKLGYVLVPKKSLSDFRKCSWIDVWDEIIYLTIVLSMASSIEKSRISKSQKRVFSYRYINNSSDIFDREYNFTSFRDEIERKSYLDENKIIVETDISNYYDRINLHRLESILKSIDGIDNDLINLLNEILLFWADRDSYGLPVGSNASRILAEAALIEVDNYLISRNIDFCRFVDDYRIFAENAFQAHSHLAILNERLSKEGLFLNNQKTNIRDISHKNKSTRDKKEMIDEESENVVRNINTNFKLEDNIENNDLPTIIRGYSGLIPTKFRKISSKEAGKLDKNDVDLLLNSAKSKLLINAEEITTLIKTIIVKREFEKLTELPNILKKFPQFIPYFVDVIIKQSSQLEEPIIKKIQDGFKIWISNQDSPEYIQVYLTRIYKNEPFQNKDILLDAFRQLKRNSGDYIGRALLEALEGLLTRGELLEIRDYYYRADKWEGRQILKLVKNGLSEGERRPFFKDVKIHEEDLFIKNIIK